MKKKIYYDKNALKELKNFNKEVQKEFQGYIEVLRREGKLDPPEAKKIDKNLFEMRAKRGGVYRGFYGYILKEYIIILHFFQKKTRKTPLKNLKIARRRLTQYE